MVTRNSMFEKVEISSAHTQGNSRRKVNKEKKLSPKEIERNNLYATFTSKQKIAFDLAMKGENLFISGGGGVGKSYLLNGIVSTLRNLYNKKVIVCAPTGVAANNIDGVTIHRQFGFPIGACLKETKKGSGKYVPYAKADKVLKSTDCIIIDEVSMISIAMFDSIYFSLQKANATRRSNNLKPIQVLILGDFYQLPPCISEEDRDILETYYNSYDTCLSGNLGNGYAFNSVNWENLNMKTILLSEVVRQKDPEMIYHLNKIREGAEGFTNFFNHKTRTEKFKNAITLYPYNSQVDKQNKIKLSELPGREYNFIAHLSGEATELDCGNKYNLGLKVGAKIMFLVNDSPRGGNSLVLNRNDAWQDEILFTNGSIGIIRDIYEDKDSPKDEFLTIELVKNGRIVKIRRNAYDVFRFQENKGKIERKKIGEYFQFPLQPAYACSVHKSQGCTFESVNINPNTFSHGQLYVALSRCTTLEGIYLEEYIKDEFLIMDKEVDDFYKSLEKQTSA